MAKVLMVTDEAAFTDELMGDERFLYGDNGGDSDGNALLPSGTIDTDVAEAVVKVGYGQIVDVKFANDEAMIRFLGFAPLIDYEDFDEGFIDQLKDAATEETVAWAHFGGYGTIDSKWIFVER